MAGTSTSRSQNLRSIYFDTAAWDLRKNGVVLHVRKTGRAAAVLCVKLTDTAAVGPVVSKEVEVRSPDLQPNLALFDENLGSELIRIVNDNPIEPKFERQIKRQTVLVNCGRSRIEATFDEGYLVGGEQRVPLNEVRLKLNAGDEANLYDLAMRAAEQFSLCLDFASKAEKGFHVTTKENRSPVKASSVQFGADATLDDWCDSDLSSTLAHFVANWAALRETQHPDCLHQMRVSLRRMRSGLAMFKRMLPCPDFDLLRSDAKRIATAMGPARECDVFRQSAEQGPLLHPDRPESCEALLKGLETRRLAAYKDANELIESPGTTLFVLKVQDFLARRAWRNGLSSSELPKLTMAAKEFARHTLDKLRSRVLKRGKGLSGLTDEARHNLRIALKNLRYGAEFFEGLFDRQRKSQSYISSITALQDVLGAQNDVVSAKQFLQELSATLWFGCGGSFSIYPRLACTWSLHRRRQTAQVLEEVQTNRQLLGLMRKREEANMSMTKIDESKPGETGVKTKRAEKDRAGYPYDRNARRYVSL